MTIQTNTGLILRNHSKYNLPPQLINLDKYLAMEMSEAIHWAMENALYHLEQSNNDSSSSSTASMMDFGDSFNLLEYMTGEHDTSSVSSLYPANQDFYQHHQQRQQHMTSALVENDNTYQDIDDNDSSQLISSVPGRRRREIRQQRTDASEILSMRHDQYQHYQQQDDCEFSILEDIEDANDCNGARTFVPSKIDYLKLFRKKFTPVQFFG